MKTLECFIKLTLLTATDNLCKQIGSRSGRKELRSKLFETLIVFLKEFLEKLILKKFSKLHQKHEKLLSMQRDKYGSIILSWELTNLIETIYNLSLVMLTSFMYYTPPPIFIL